MRYYFRMVAKEISSLQHPIVKHLVNLRTNRKYREEKEGLLLLGDKMILEVKKPIKTLLITMGSPIPSHLNFEKAYLITEEMLKKISGMQSVETLAAEVSFPTKANLNHKKLLLGLDNISDPGNMGTMFRSALALGWDGIFLSEDSVDPFNDKALRAAKGASLILPFSRGNELDFYQLVEKNNLHGYIADSSGDLIENISFKFPLILILGNEARGVTQFHKKEFPKIAIPMQGRAESLNVATAAAILMHYIKSRIHGKS
ncbi:MAG: RNA methyltransferase [Chlamydiae bacterium]|nr:RNA methyltransferase [Chlamydiota bacterium]